MKTFFPRGRWKALRLLLAMLLPLHAGLAQATMVMAPHAPVAAEATVMSDAMPCHHAQPDSSVQDHPSPHKGGCCDAGSCHCAAACATAVLITRIQPQPGVGPALFAFLSVPAAAHPPDLRPPIA